MKKYLDIAKLNIQVSTAYRLETFNWMVISAISTITSALVFFTVSKTGAFSNYSSSEMATYIILSFLLERFLFWYFCFWFGESIKKGSLGSYLTKPYNMVLDQVISEISRKILFTIPYFVIAITLIYFFNAKVQLNIEKVFYFIPIFIIAIIINILFASLLSFVAFFTINNHSIVNLYFYIIPFIGGRAFPIDIIPHPFVDIIKLTPFPYTFFYPIQMLSKNNLTYEQLNKILYTQIVWLIIISIFTRFVYKKGLKQYDSAGN